MASLNHIVLGILTLHIYVYAAPSDVSKIEDIATVEKTDPKLDSEPTVVESDNSMESQRQKRWYNPYGFGLSPISPLIYPNFNNNGGPNSGFYGGEDPLAQIHRRLQEIANIVRQPPPPPPPQIPLFYPVLFIPSGDCRCNENTTPENETSQPVDNNNTTPSVVNRWPAMEDERQNWGLLVNETDADDEEEFSRPISFDPIRLDRPMRPAPPIDHGTVQSESTQDQTQSEEPSSPPPPPQNTSPPQNSPANFSPAQSRPQNSSPPQNNMPAGLAPPSACDGAILTCCHQPQVYYDCFAIQGCPDFTSYGNPCDPNLIIRVIERFQTFYGQRTG